MTSLIPAPDGITLVGRDGTTVPLYRPEGGAEHSRRHNQPGVFLREVPEFLHGFRVAHQKVTTTGGVRIVGAIPQSSTVSLKLKLQGISPRSGTPFLEKTARGQLALLQQALGDGSEPVQIVVRSPRYGHRYVEAYAEGMTSVDWPTSPHMASIAFAEITLEVPDPVWRGQRVRASIDAREIRRLPLIGEMRVWRVRYQGDRRPWGLCGWQGTWGIEPGFIPPGAATAINPRKRENYGWALDMRPASQRVYAVHDRTGREGGDYAGYVPWIPEPMRLVSERVEGQRLHDMWLEVPIRIPAVVPDDAVLTVDYYPESVSAW